jgi:hypothetical protein
MPTEDADPFLAVIFFAAVDQCRINRHLPRQGRPFFQAGEELPRHGPAGLDLHRHRSPALLDQDAHLNAVAVAPEMELGGACHRITWKQSSALSVPEGAPRAVIWGSFCDVTHHNKDATFIICNK